MGMKTGARHTARALFMRITGLEPARVAPLEPKSSASANSAISAAEIPPEMKARPRGMPESVDIMPVTGIEPVRVSLPAGF